MIDNTSASFTINKHMLAPLTRTSAFLVILDVLDRRRIGKNEVLPYEYHRQALTVANPFGL